MRIPRATTPSRLVVVALLAYGITGPRAMAWAGNDEQEKAVASIHKLGGRVKRDESRPEWPALEVNFSNTDVTDAGLVYLKGMTSLRTLDLGASLKLQLPATKVTDAGLVHLEGLTDLQTLNLRGTNFTDAGLGHLKGMTSLQNLSVSRTKITEAGLAHLKGLTGLRTLNLQSTKVTDAELVHLTGKTGLQYLNLLDTGVTDAGIEGLRRALPDAIVVRSIAQPGPS